MHRHHVSESGDWFSRTATRTKKINLGATLQRGGIRL